MTQEHEKAFLDFFTNSLGLYKKTKELIISIEQHGADNAPPIHQINELRNTLDHIYRAIEYPKRTSTELNEASEHLYRAAFDSYAILCSILILNIKNVSNSYKRETLSSVYPEYYQDITPKIAAIQDNISSIRARKEIDTTTNNKEFESFWEQIVALRGYKQKLSSLESDFIEYEREEQKRSRWGRFWTIFWTVACLIVANIILKILNVIP